jgi:peptidylprolyl isomerase domain and WD repeat-containing protein 1
VRIFHFESGKILRRYDESVATASHNQKDEAYEHYLDPIDFGHRVAVENALGKAYLNGRPGNTPNIVFDESENYIAYPYETFLSLLIF